MVRRFSRGHADRGARAVDAHGHAPRSRRRRRPHSAGAGAGHVARSPWPTLAVSRGYVPEQNVITCAMAESPRLHFDDVSREPERLLTGIGDAMTAPGSWNMWFVSDMVVAMSPQHASLCADAGM